MNYHKLEYWDNYLIGLGFQKVGHTIKFNSNESNGLRVDYHIDNLHEGLEHLAIQLNIFKEESIRVDFYGVGEKVEGFDQSLYFHAVFSSLLEPFSELRLVIESFFDLNQVPLLVGIPWAEPLIEYVLRELV